MKAYLTRRYLFSASHRLHCDEMSAAENQAVYGKCNNRAMGIIIRWRSRSQAGSIPGRAWFAIL